MATLISIRGLHSSEAGTSGTSIRRGFRIRGSAVASLTTSLAGTNNDLVFTAKTGGTGGNAIRVRYVVAGASTPLSVSVSSNDITVNVATNGASAATSTALQVRDAVNASGPASALVGASLAPGNDGTGVVAALAFTNLAGGAAESNVMVGPNTDVAVDIDNANVRKTLSRHHDQWVTNVGPAGPELVIRSLDAQGQEAQSQVSRGWRVGTTGLRIGGAAATVNLDDPKHRKALKQHYSRWIEANTTNSLVTIRGVQTSAAATGGGLSSRGFRIKNQAGNQVAVTPSANVQVNVSDPYVRRILRRNVGRYLVVSSP